MDINIKIEVPDLSAALQAIATALAGQVNLSVRETKTSQTKPKPEPETHIEAKPEPKKPTVTKEQVMTAGAALVDKGLSTQLVELLKSFGVRAVTDLTDTQLDDFYTKMEELKNAG